MPLGGGVVGGREMDGLLRVPVMATPGVTVTVTGTVVTGTGVAGDCVTGTAGVRGPVMTTPGVTGAPVTGAAPGVGVVGPWEMDGLPAMPDMSGQVCTVLLAHKGI